MADASQVMPSDEPPIQEVQQNRDGTWQVAVTWCDGRREWHGSFKTELEAEEWALYHIQSWQEGRWKPRA